MDYSHLDINLALKSLSVHGKIIRFFFLSFFFNCGFILIYLTSTLNGIESLFFFCIDTWKDRNLIFEGCNLGHLSLSAF